MKFSTLQPFSLLAASIALVTAQSGYAQLTNINETFASTAAGITNLVTAYNNAGLSSTLSGLEDEMFQLCQDYDGRIANASTVDEIQDGILILTSIAHEEVAGAGSGFSDTGQDMAASVLGRIQFLRTGAPVASNGNLMLNGGAAGDEFSKLSYFVNAYYGDGEKDRTNRELGFDFDSQGITVGVDYRFSDETVGGVALSFGQSEVDYEAGLGGTENDSYSLTFYGSHYIDNWYIDAVLGYSQHDYDNTRNLLLTNLISGPPPLLLNGDQRIKSDTDGDAFNWSIGGGYTHVVDGWTNNYSARLEGVDASIDGYTEDLNNSLALRIGDQDVESLQLIAAAQFNRSYSYDWGVLNPYLGVEVDQEFDDETRVVTAQYAYDRFGNQFSFTSDDSDSSYFVVSLGSSFVLGQGKQLFVNLDHIAGLDDVDSNTLTAGIRFEL